MDGDLLKGWLADAETEDESSSAVSVSLGRSNKDKRIAGLFRTQIGHDALDSSSI